MAIPPRPRTSIRAAVVGLLTVGLVGSGCVVSPPASTPAQERVTSAATAATPQSTVRGLPVNAVADYQLGGSYAPARGVGVVTRDRSDAPARGTYGICYVNAFQTQPDERSFWRGARAKLLLRDKAGRLVQDPGWPGEYLLDISTTKRRAQLAAIVDGWFRGCARAGYRAVEPDNLDSWTRSRGRLTESHAAGMARLLVARAHRAGLAIAQKNTAELLDRDLGFDFAVAEECQVYAECESYRKRFGNRLIEIEYADQPLRFYRAACARRGRAVAVLLRDRDVVPRGTRGYVYRHC